MDLLHKAAGITARIDEAQREALQPSLVEAAVGFLRAGGMLSLADYALLDPDSRAAMQRAGEILRAELAAQVGLSAQSAAGTAEVLSTIDGGAAKLDLAAHRVVEKAARKLNPSTGPGQAKGRA